MKKLIMFFLLIIGTLAYSFQIDDITFDAQVGGNGYREYKIYNEQNAKAIYKVLLRGVGDKDITKDMTVYPKVLSIEPRSYATLKLYGGDHTDLPNGEYTFYLTFHPVVLPKIVKDGKDGEIVGTSTVALIPDIEMKAYVGDIDWTKVLDIENISEFKDKDGKLHIKFDVVNKGYTSVTVATRVANKGESKTYSKYLGRVKPNSKLTKEIEVPFDNLEEIENIWLYNSSLKTIYIDKNLKTKEKIGGKKL